MLQTSTTVARTRALTVGPAALVMVMSVVTAGRDSRGLDVKRVSHAVTITGKCKLGC